jgi:4-hydroxybenzoate polyprenyltransferase
MGYRLLALAFRISRFRFWIYTGGTYVVGYALGMDAFSAFFRPEYYVYLLYFFFPANVFIYGVNDYWDGETDAGNPKKEGKEHRMDEGERRDTIRMIALVGGISLLLLLFQDPVERVVFLLFLFLSYFYSARPLRFKEMPFLDFSSNMLYVMPGIFGYYLAGGTLPSIPLITAGYLHISAMHLFSAIPDIPYDREAGISTTAVVLDRRRSLLLCLIIWFLLSLLAILLAGFHPLSFLVLIYPLIPLLLLVSDHLSIDRAYWYLPYINTCLGGLLFGAVTIAKFP